MPSKSTIWRRNNPEKYRAQYERAYKCDKDKITARAKINAAKRIAERKKMLSEYPCRACGHNDPTVIQWHHLDPSTKSFEIWQAAFSEDNFWNEVLKCVPLCANCHVKIHHDLLCLLPINRIG